MKIDGCYKYQSQGFQFLVPPQRGNVRQQLLNTAVKMRQKVKQNSLKENGIQLVGQRFSTGGPMEGASGEFPHHFVCLKMPC